MGAPFVSRPSSPIGPLSPVIERNIPVDFLIYRPEEFEKRLEMGDPFLKAILKEGKVLYG
jgi:hypothetical protein